MILLVFLILFLYVSSVLLKKPLGIFIKQKVIPLKAILGIGIVLHHLSLNINENFLAQFHAWGKIIVAIFFFISGYGLMKSWMQKGKSYLSGFIRHRILNSLFLPFFLATLFYAILNWNIIAAPRVLLYNWSVIGITLLPNAWFVYILLIMYLAFYIGCKIREGEFIGEFVCVVCALFYIYAVIVDMGNWTYVSNLAFPLGIFYSQYENKLISLCNKKTLNLDYCSVMIPFLLIGVAILFYINYFIVSLSIIIFIIVLLCSKLEIERLGVYKIVIWISGISYEIYLCHGIVMKFLRGQYMHIESDYMYVLLTLLLTLVLSYLLKLVVNHIRQNLKLK